MTCAECLTARGDGSRPSRGRVGWRPLGPPFGPARDRDGRPVSSPAAHRPLVRLSQYPKAHGPSVPPWHTGRELIAEMPWRVRGRVAHRQLPDRWPGSARVSTPVVHGP